MSLAGDWTDLETLSCAPTNMGGPCADPGAAWGLRAAMDRPKGRTAFGYYLSAATMVVDQGCPRVPELIRRINVTTCSASTKDQLTTCCASTN